MATTHPPAPHWIEPISRHPLGFLPTPLVPLDRLSEFLGGPRIWIKRDDCTGLATGGNKTRKLEYLLAAAQAAGADTVVTFGAVQSNHARQTAAACAALGIECHLILVRKVASRHPAYERSGNVLLDRLLGAHVHITETAAAESAGKALLATLSDAGRNVYVIPVGGSNEIGALGYVRCAREILQQCEARDLPLRHIVHASSSAGTQSGLLAGLIDHEAVAVHGVNVSEPDPSSLETAVADLTDAVLREHQPAASLARSRVHVDHRFFGAGYGIPTDATLEAIRLLGRLEGVLVDPVYTGKALAALHHGIRAGEYGGASDVVFIHTGGVASLPAYDDVL